MCKRVSPLMQGKMNEEMSLMYIDMPQGNISLILCLFISLERSEKVIFERCKSSEADLSNGKTKRQGNNYWQGLLESL